MDRAAADELVKGHLPLVRAIARQVANVVGRGGLPFEDLESAGREGLVMAAQRFEEDRGIPFGRYAQYRVRGAIIDMLRRESALPRRAHERLRELEAAADLNEAKSEELSAPEAPGTTTAMRDQKLADHLANLATAFATGLLHRSVVQDDERVLVDPIPAADERLEGHETLEQIRRAVETLPEQEKILVRRHYFEGDRFDHVAKELGLSKSWASRLHTRAIGR